MPINNNDVYVNHSQQLCISTPIGDEVYYVVEHYYHPDGFPDVSMTVMNKNQIMGTIEANSLKLCLRGDLAYTLGHGWRHIIKTTQIKKFRWTTY